MKSVALNVEERSHTGTAACRRMRKQGVVPMNLYGLGRPVRLLSARGREIQRLLDQGVHIVDLTLSGKTQAALVKDIQYDAIGSEILHADLQRVDRNQPVHVYVPIRFLGTAPSIAGSLVEKLMEDIQLECLPLEIPDAFSINLSKLEIGQSVTVGDLEMPENCKPHGCHEDDIVVINHMKVHRDIEDETEEEGEEGPSEPELIGRNSPEGED